MSVADAPTNAGGESVLEDTWVVIPVHDRREITLSCLSELRDGEDWDALNVVVVDDGSTDGTAAAIRDEFPSVHLVDGDGTLWWGGAVRAGMEYALDRDGEIVVWLNDDVYPDPGAVEALASRVAASPDALLGGLIRPTDDIEFHSTVNGRKQPYTTRWKKTRLGLVPREYDPTREVQPSDALSGRFTAIHRRVVEDIGLPDDETFPQNYCDHDYTYRAKEAGFDLGIYTPATARDTDASPYRSRISPAHSFEKVLKDSLYARRKTGRSYLEQFRRDRRFVDGPLPVVALAMAYHALKISGGLALKLLLALLSSDHRLRE